LGIFGWWALIKLSPSDFKQFREEQLTAKVTIYKEKVSDPYEKSLVTDEELNPIYIKGLVREVSASRLVWQLFGLKEKGAVEFVTDKFNNSILERASVIEIKGVTYKVYREAVSKRATITRKNNVVVAVLERL
jgi:hypothetical protein